MCAHAACLLVFATLAVIVSSTEQGTPADVDCHASQQAVLEACDRHGVNFNFDECIKSAAFHREGRENFAYPIALSVM